MHNKPVVIEIMRTVGIKPEDLEKFDAWDGELVALLPRPHPGVDIGCYQFTVSESEAAAIEFRLVEAGIKFERRSLGWDWQMREYEKEREAAGLPPAQKKKPPAG